MRTVSITALIGFVLVMFFAFSGCSHFTHNHGTVQKDAHASGTMHQTTCPVMGGEIDKNVYVDYQGKRVFFCCKMCVDKFKEDPEKYMKKL